MNRNICLGFILGAALAACGTEDPSTDVTEQEAAVEELAPEAVEETAVVEATEATQPELVEESAAEPDEDQAEDQPILLAQETATATAAPPREWSFSEGTHYHRLIPTQPTVGGADKIEVAEVFWYGCPHCYTFEPLINDWAENVPANARFVRIPAVWNPLAKLHGRLYYTEEVLARTGKLKDVSAFHAAVFNEFHRKSNRLTSENAIQKMFASFGVNDDDFLSAWNSFEVDQKVRVANDLIRRYNVTGVPAIVVNGKYRTGASDAGSYEGLIEVIDELVARESVR